MEEQDHTDLLRIVERFGIAREALEECLRVRAHGSQCSGGTITEDSADHLDRLKGRPLVEVLVALGHLERARREAFEAELPTAIREEGAPTRAGRFETLHPVADAGPGGASSATPIPETHYGNVKVNRKLGAGGMGEVYLGFHDGFGLPVAVKLLPERFSDKPDLAERFMREAQVAVRLDHPNVVRLFDVGRQGKRIYIVMEYVEGQDLDRYEEDHGGRLPVPEVLRLIGQVAQGLAYAHSQGVVHRDIKPANCIRRARDERVKILDFGLARSRGLDHLTAGPAMMGTLPYMSKEQLMGAATAASDVYSLGVTAYRMLTGRLPVEGELPDILRYHTQGGTAPAVESVRPVPERVARLVARTLASKQEDRPTAAQAASEIDAILGEMGEPGANAAGSEPPRSPATCVPRLDERPPAASAEPAPPLPTRSRVGPVLAVLGLLAVLGAAPFLWKSGPEPATTPPAATKSVFSASAAVFIAPPRTRGAAAEMVGDEIPGSAEERPPVSEVKEGNGIRFVLRSEDPITVYVFNVDGAGQGMFLFPDHYENEARRQVGEGKAVGGPRTCPLAPEDGAVLIPPTLQLPTGGKSLMRFTFDNTLGDEWFLVAAARRPVPELEDLRAKVKGRRPGDPAHDEAVAAIKRFAQRWESASLGGGAAPGGTAQYHKGDGEKPLGNGWYVRKGAELVVWTLELKHK